MHTGVALTGGGAGNTMATVATIVRMAKRLIGLPLGVDPRQALRRVPQSFDREGAVPARGGLGTAPDHAWDGDDYGHGSTPLPADLLSALLLTITFISITVRVVMGRLQLKILAATMVVAGIAGGCGTGRSDPAGGGTKPMVVAAFYPLAFATEAVGGGLVRVENLTPSGVEPHDLELSADQIRSLSDADLIIFLGEGFQPAIEDVVSGMEASRTFDVLHGLDLLQGVDGDEREGDEEHDESTADPHVWLDPSIMTAIVDEVTARLAEIDPDNNETYEANAAELNSRLVTLDGDFSQALSRCPSRDIVTSHAAFGYLATRYDLNQVSISGIDPEAEPSPARLAEVARFVQEHDVSTIFFEELVSPDVAETIAAETGAQTAMLSPLESEPSSGDYVDAMEANLATITKALDCG